MKPNDHRSAWATGLLLLMTVLVAGCAPAPAVQPVEAGVSREVLAAYSGREDNGFLMPAIPARHLEEPNPRRVVDYWTSEPAGTIVIDPYDNFLYYVLGNDRAIRYRVGVGEAGRNFSGRATVAFKREWPTWTPTGNMLREDPELYGPHRGGMPGGLENPLGARALYLYRNGRDTLYRIHGTYAPWSVGIAVSAGCIRMFNHDVIDLYQRVDPGTRVVVLRPDQAGQGTAPPIPEVAQTLAADLPG
jgi:lipoprotein-anchoring transpeptidase ErfK/SrfK